MHKFKKPNSFRLDPYSKAKYDTILTALVYNEAKLDPYSKAKYDTIKR